MLRMALVLSFVSFASIAAQTLPEPEVRTVAEGTAPRGRRYTLQWPAGSARDAWHPVAVVFLREPRDVPPPAMAALARAGFVVVCPEGENWLASLFADVR